MEKLNLPQELDPSQIERREKIEKLKHRYLKIAKAIGAGQYPEDPAYHGEISHGALQILAGKSIGTSTVYNSPFQSAQLIIALAMSRDARIEEIVQQENPGPVFKIGTREKFLEKWGGVLNGLKIIDIGCGYEPTFARASRGLGAEVFTVDIIPASQFENFHPKRYDGENDAVEIADHELAKKFHIQMDLDDEDALQKILEITGGEFDYATEAHSGTGVPHGYIEGEDGNIINSRKIYRFRPGKDFYNPLLKKDGVFFALGSSTIGTGPLSVDKERTEIKGDMGLDIKL